MNQRLLPSLLFFCSTQAAQPPLQPYTKINMLRSSHEVVKTDWAEQCENCSNCCWLVVPAATCCCISAKLLARWYQELTPLETAATIGAGAAWVAWGWANKNLRERNNARQLLRNQLKAQESKKIQ